mmetsp:Transcript_86418/g.129582  ORF Transcript_86418/g.129582 Transcript_86418/m.129582 type:complete len:253 (-) Transcript_86418:447-1205(-)
MGPMMPAATMSSCAETVVDFANISPGKRTPKSVAIHPTVASMQTRPCLSSASRQRYTGSASVTLNGSKPFSQPTKPSSCAGYIRYGTDADLRSGSPSSGTALIFAARLVMLLVDAAGFNAQAVPPMHTGMSLTKKSTGGPQKPSVFSISIGFLLNMPSWTIRPIMPIMASRPLLRSTVWRRSSSSAGRPSKSSVPRPKSHGPMPPVRGLTNTSCAPMKATSCTQPSTGIVDSAPRPFSKLSHPGKRKTSGMT